jgi:uncharacterized protein (DUF302 family)
MQRDATVGYELPLRLLIWDAKGQTMIGYQRPTGLRGDYAVADQVEILHRMENLLEEIIAETSHPDSR